jgi:TonB family protein
VWNDLIHLLIIAVVILVLFVGRKIKPRKPPTHPLPVASPMETSRGSVAPKEKPWQALIPRISQTTCVVVICTILCSVSVAGTSRPMPQAASEQSAKTERPPDGLEILTPHEGVDFTAFSPDLLRTVRRSWLAKMPSEAKNENTKGRVAVRFAIQKDGSLSHVPTVEVSSGRKAFDDAAVSAVRSSAPFDHLPESFKGPNIELRLIFLYNLPLSALNP